ncbi:Rhomboid-like protein 19 [Neolecta irregularis DAH-3]|uniref:Rhomboid-like protein 19 n=1 Tax=Neolecta irregularis (strain DAH-3) TaxID=1198029 RepID=A0A1U7LU13_NEOID|nr:Rhomboid-like protein 19 [Neolecta irregularis DAH-3]|eukprot:OLL26032.1 Rhomboid-like protein 19 [Neolecta irregularis DAH-3]
MASRFFITIPPVTRTTVGVSMVSTLIVTVLRLRAYLNGDSGSSSGVPYSVPYMTIIPNRSIVYPWTLLISSYVETNIFALLISFGTFLYAGRYFERAWNSKEYLKFLLIVTVIPNLCSMLFSLVAYGLTAKLSYLLMPICGSIGIQAGILVAFKQIVPEHTVNIFRSAFRMRVKHFPVLFVLVMSLASFASSSISAQLTCFGFISAWTYLRFYKRSMPDLGVPSAVQLKGDGSPAFSFASFFPDALQPSISVISDFVYHILALARLCTPFERRDLENGNPRPDSRGAAQPGAARAEAERRRALALKTLDKKMDKHQGPSRQSSSETPMLTTDGEETTVIAPPLDSPVATPRNEKIDPTSYAFNKEGSR